jgi:predicted transcriptional regulator
MSVSPEQIALTAEQKQRLARLAEQTGRSWDELLADAIASLENGESTVVGTRESVYDAMVRLGLLGCVKDGPPDLSSNPKYMEGFGRRGR